MESLGEFARWIAENEALLSGLASLVVLVGLVLSPFGTGIRRLFARTEPKAPSGPSTESETASRAPDSFDPVLAVLAFDNLSSDPEMQFFSDGISEEIIQRLSRGAKLKVIGRASSFQFRGERKAEAARALDCTHVLDGSVRRSGNDVRISPNLAETGSQTTLWSERYDRKLDDVFAVQDEIADSIAGALDRTFASFSTEAVDPEVYDLYLRARPSSYAPDELQASIGPLEEATRRAPVFTEAWGRLAFVRAWWHFYQPFADRPAIAAKVNEEAGHALAADPHEPFALMAKAFVAPPFGHFLEADEPMDRLRASPGADPVRGYVGWYLRTTGHVRQSLEEAERAYRLDALDSMVANLLALARMAAGRVDEAVPVFEDLAERAPGMSFPVANLLRAHAFREDWEAVDRVLDLAAKRDLREFEAGLPFIETKRNPTDANLDAWRSRVEADVASAGCIDLSQLVYTAHLGLVDEAYRAADAAWLGPTGNGDDVMGPDGYRTSLMFQHGMPELRRDARFPRLCARLGLVEFWTTTGKWPDCADELPYDFRSECARVQDVAKDEPGARVGRAAE